MWLVHMRVPTTPLLSYFVYCAAIPNEEGELNIPEKFRRIPRGNQDGWLKPEILAKTPRQLPWRNLFTKMVLLSFISYASTELPLELMLGSLDR